ALTKLCERGDIDGKARETVPLYAVSGIAAQRLLVLGMGQRRRADPGLLVNAAAAAAKFISRHHCQRIALALPDGIPNLYQDSVAKLMTIGLIQGCEGPGIRKNKPDRFAPEEILLAPSSTVMITKTGLPAAALYPQGIDSAIQEAHAEGRGVSLARELV